MNHPSKKQRKAEFKEFRKVLNKLGFKNYQVYLKSEYWIKIREKAFLRDQYTCQRCKSPSQYAHHLSYTEEVLHGKDLSQIISLCIPCHEYLEFLKTDKGKKVVDLHGEGSREFQEKFQKWKEDKRRKNEPRKQKTELPKDIKCIRCRKVKPLGSFLINSSKNLQTRCAECRQERSSNYLKKNGLTHHSEKRRVK